MSVPKILLTGAAGFIGSNALRYFYKSHEFTPACVVDRISYAANVAWVTKYPVNFYRQDIADCKWQYILEKEDVDVVINFAAESHVDNSIHASAESEFVKSNLSGVCNLLHGIRLHKKITGKSIFLLQVSTDEVLGDLPIDSDVECDESYPLHPNNPYAATKAAAELWLQSMHHTHKDFEYAIVRATNNYGPHQHFEKFLPTVIRSLAADEKVPLYGDGSNVREWLWTGDFVRGIAKVVKVHRESPESINSQIFHFGSGVRISNLEAVRSILEQMGRTERMIEFVTDRPGHDRKYALSFKKAKEVLDWEPQMSFDIGIMLVIRDVKERLKDNPTYG